MACDYPDELRYDGERDLQRAALFDFVTANLDRHIGNWLVDESQPGGKLALIDHGLAFEYEPGWFIGFLNEAYSRWSQEPIPPELKRTFIEQHSRIVTAAEIAGVPPDNVAWLGERLQKLADARNWSELWPATSP
jgi:hypothetical protein